MKTRIRKRDGFNGQRFIALSQSNIDTLSVNPVTNGLYVTAIGHFPNAEYHYVHRPNGCCDYILLFCMSGRGIVNIDSKKNELRAGQYIVIPPSISHTYMAGNTWTVYWIHFRGYMAETFCKNLHDPSTIYTSDNSRIADRNALFDELYNALDGKPDIKRLEYSSILFTYYLATFIYIDIYRFTRNNDSTSHSDTIVRKAVHYLNEHIENNITIDELATWCGYSKSYVYRKFIKEVGQAPMEYFIHLKINRACYLLLHTNLSINQISLKLAFSESQYFARTFMKVMGVSASDYRKKMSLNNHKFVSNV